MNMADPVGGVNGDPYVQQMKELFEKQKQTQLEVTALETDKKMFDACQQAIIKGSEGLQA